MRFLSLIGLMTLMLFSVARGAEPGCGEFRDDGGRTLSYCRADGSATVLYYFHGLGGDASLQKEPVKSLIANARRLLGARAPSVISLSLGKEGVFKDDNVAFARESAAKIEALLKTPPTKRVLVGLSMGGHNALRVLMEAPGEYAAASLLCPALLDIDGYDAAEKQAYIDRHRDHLDPRFFDRAWAIYSREFPTAARWRVNNPFVALRAGRLDGVPLFLSTGRNDSLGFFEGATSWVTAARERSDTVTWAPVDGSHCTFDSFKLLDFLARRL